MSEPRYKSVNDILGDSTENVLKEFSSSEYSLTYIMTLKKNFELEYQRVEVTKDKILESIDKGTTESNEKNNKLIEDLYLVLQKIEDVCTVFEAIRKERTITS